MAWNLEEALNYYEKQGAPRDQSAVIGLLKEISGEMGGGIPMSVLETAAERYGVKVTFLLAIIKRIPGLRLTDSRCLEMCAGPNCGRHTALADAAEKLCRQHNVTLRFVPCMRLCGKGPNIKWNGRIHHGATEALISELLCDNKK